MKSELVVQFKGHEVNNKKLIEIAKEIWKSEGNKVKDLLTLELYYKPEESRCYYVFNGKCSENSFFEV